MTTSVEVAGDTIRVTAPYTMTVALKAIPGARFDSANRAWVYPASPHVAQALARVLAADPSMTSGRKWDALVDAAAAEQQANGAKDAADLPEIPGLAGESWEHQRRAYAFANGRTGTMLAMKMGSGKSRVAVGLMRQASSTLVLCPLSVVPVWPAEIRKHAPDWQPIVAALDSGSVVDKRDVLVRTFYRDDGHPRVVIVNYDSARMDPLGKWLTSKNWDLVILDESHRVKAPGGRTSMFVARLRDRARKRVALTGTPMAHSPLDLYGQYRFLDPGIFGTSYVRFKGTYANVVNVGFPKIVGWRNMDDLNARFHSAAYVFDGDLGLPEATHVERYGVLEDGAARGYRELEEDLYTRVESGEVTAANALVLLLRLAQLTGGWLRDESGDWHEVSRAKADLLSETLEGIGAEPVVVVCRFQHDMDTVHVRAAKLGLTSAELSGRRKELEAWQRGDAQVLAVQIQAGGVGISLVRARYMVLYSVGYSLSDFDQVLARVHRPGQHHPVTYVHLTIRGTVDESIRKALEERRDLVEEAMRRRA